MVWLVDAKVETGLGGLESLWAGINDGETAVRPVERFPVEGLGSGVASLIGDLEAADGHTLCLDLVSRVVEGLREIPSDAHFLSATTKGGIDLWCRSRRGEETRKDEIPLAGLLGEITAMAGVEKPGSNINAACASSTFALARAASRIRRGDVESALVVGYDVITDFVFAGFSCLRALSPVSAKPFDRSRKGLSLGEGAVALLLMSEERAKREGRQPLAELAGWGVANDANHITAPARDACGLIEAVGVALESGGVTNDKVSAISAHGTGTLFNDAMEATGFKALFGEEGRVPAFSVKGAIGHTLGAAGGIEAALCCKMLETGCVPPTVGLEEVDPEASDFVNPGYVKFDGEYALSTNSGFGGVNCALLFRRVDS